MNERAEMLMGRRSEGVVAIDLPCELGFECPICKVASMVGDEFDERLHWSECNGFIWCLVCDRDYPSALCVPLDGLTDPKRDHVRRGPEAAVDIFLNTVREAAEFQVAERLAAANALIVRYWCGDAPEGSGLVTEIKTHFLALPAAEQAALAFAIEDDEVTTWLSEVSA